jgi:hypothetical protein
VLHRDVPLAPSPRLDISLFLAPCVQDAQESRAPSTRPPDVIVRRVLAISLAAVVLAGCASLPPRVPPRIDVVAVALERIEGPRAFFGVTLQLTNDGDSDIVIDALQGALSIEGESVAQAALASPPVRVPAHGTARAEMAAQTGMDAMLRAIAAAMRRGATLVAPGSRPTLRYSIAGTATLGGGYRLPFSRAGEIGEGS